MHVCKFCGRKFETGQQLGGHVILCKKNPNRKQLVKKINEKKPKKQTYKVLCEVCGNEFEIYVFPSQIKRGDHRKTCSSKCAHKLTSLKTNKVDKNTKISEALSGREYPKIDKFCIECNNIIPLERRKTNFCSDKCMLTHKHRALSLAAKERNLGGLNPENTHKNYKCGYYQGIWCDSSWELAYILYQKDHSIEVERNLTPYEYVFEGKIYKFYPDFIVNGELVEIKGFFDAKNIAKKEQVKNVIFIGAEEMKPILKYVIQKYGNDFTSLYSR